MFGRADEKGYFCAEISKLSKTYETQTVIFRAVRRGYRKVIVIVNGHSQQKTQPANFINFQTLRTLQTQKNNFRKN